MTERLFSGSFHQVWQNALRSAVNQVTNLDRELFSNLALDGHLQKIAEKHSFNVARINKEGISAKRRETEREGHDSWGDHRRIKQKWLDVDIPFNGDKESFQIAPSRSTIPSHHAAIGRNSLTLTLPDDDRVQSEVDGFVTQLTQNLDTLRAEYEKEKPQLMEAIKQAADQRKKQIDLENARDKKLSFPVRN